MLNPSSSSIQAEAERASPTAGRLDVGALSDAHYPAAGLVPDYELLRRIGRGAYGEVWLARSKATGALRAAKIVWRHRFEDERPFQREFEGIQRFERISREHPSQLALFHIGRNEAEGYFYYVMELADDLATRGDGVSECWSDATGKRLQDSMTPALQSAAGYAPHTLSADLARGRLPAARVLEIGLALAEALGHLHRHGLIHRDVKPSNVIFVNGRPKLADIGLVTDASDQCSIVGTEGYLPPEGPGTPQADIFALGKVLYEAATGMDRREFPKLPADLRSWPDAALRFELNEIVLRAGASDASGRYTTADAMLSDLQLLERGKSVKRNRAAQVYGAAARKIGIGLAAFLALAAAVVVLVRGLTQEEPNPDGPPSTSFEANAYCDTGLNIIRRDNYAWLAQAYTNFLMAASLDPTFARPYVGLMEMGLREPVPDLETTDSATMRRLAGKLKELAPHLAATATAQSITSYYDWNFPDAERCALQAIKANPDYEAAHAWYAHMLTLWGRPVEARVQLEISRSLTLSKASIYRGLGHTYFAQHDFTNAATWYARAIALDPHHEQDFFHLGRALRALGDYSGSISNMERGALLNAKDKQAVREKYRSLREAFDQHGAPGYWQQDLRLCERELKPDAGFYQKAVSHLQLGNPTKALDLLEDSYRAHERIAPTGDCGLNYLLFDEYWHGLRDDQRFKQLLNKVGFTKVMPPTKK